jgi:hypothetical protein
VSSKAILVASPERRHLKTGTHKEVLKKERLMVHNRWVAADKQVKQRDITFCGGNVVSYHPF